LIVAFQLIVIHTQNNKKIVGYNAKFNTILLISLALTLIQIVLGTDVREQVDIISKQVRQKLASKSNPSVLYSSFFFIVVLLTNLYLFSLNHKLSLGFSKKKWVIAILIMEIFLNSHVILIFHLYTTVHVV
jgi:cytochrome c oxidase assembly protein subunit 15